VRGGGDAGRAGGSRRLLDPLPVPLRPLAPKTRPVGSLSLL
jgi:hypothetical protein